jgi:hypothetical protein
MLLIAARKFQVVSCLDSGNNLSLIQIKEIESDYLLLGPPLKKFLPGLLNNRFPLERHEDSATASEDSYKTQESAFPKMPPLPQFPPRFPF